MSTLRMTFVKTILTNHLISQDVTRLSSTKSDRNNSPLAVLSHHFFLQLTVLKTTFSFLPSYYSNKYFLWGNILGKTFPVNQTVHGFPYNSQHYIMTSNTTAILEYPYTLWSSVEGSIYLEWWILLILLQIGIWLYNGWNNFPLPPQKYLSAFFSDLRKLKYLVKCNFLTTKIQ